MSGAPLFIREARERYFGLPDRVTVGTDGSSLTGQVHAAAIGGVKRASEQTISRTEFVEVFLR